MEVLKELNDLNAALQHTLTGISPVFTATLTGILSGENMAMRPYYRKEDVASFNFEYRHEWLTMTFFGSNASGSTITEELDFLGTELKAYHALAKEILDKIGDLEDELKSGEEWDQMMEAYDMEKYDIFEDWFTDCWRIAVLAAGSQLPTYLSMAELDSGFELMAWESVEINKDQPNRRRYIH